MELPYMSNCETQAPNFTFNSFYKIFTLRERSKMDGKNYNDALIKIVTLPS